MARVAWQWPVLGAGLVISAVALYSVEWVEVTTNEGPTLEALRNPYLAADEYLTHIGVEVDRGTRLVDVADRLDVDDGLVMTTSRATLSETAVTDLLHWVDEGGHMVVLAVNEYDPAVDGSHDPLLDRLEVRLTLASDVEAVNETLEDVVGSTVGSEAFCHSEPPASNVHVGDDTTLQVQFAERHALEYDGDVAGVARNGVGDQLLQLERGNGLITVLTTTRMWRNARIGCHDHAHLLGILLGDSSRVWWLAGVEMPSLYQLLWRHFPYGLLGALLALLLWAWRRAFRFGPVRGTQTAPRRSLLEHVRAAAAFYWRHDRGAALLTFLREDVLARASDGALLAAGAERAGISREQLEWALTAPAARSREEFLTCVQVLQRMRRVI